MKIAKKDRFERIPLVFFVLMDDPKFSQKHKTLNDRHLTLVLGKD